MREPENERTNERKLAALFAAAGAPPESDPQFVAVVMGRIQHRERMRLWVLGGSALLAVAFGLPAMWDLAGALGELLTGWNGVDAGAISGLGGWLDQSLALIGDYLGAAARSIPFVTAAILAAAIFPLLRWLAD